VSKELFSKKGSSKDKEEQAEKKARKEKKEAARLEQASLTTKPSLPTIPKVPKAAQTQTEPAKKSVQTQTEAEKPGLGEEVKKLGERLTEHVGWALSKSSEQGLATKRVEQRVNERADTLIRNTNSRISRVERKFEGHIQDYNQTESRKQPLLTYYFRLQNDILQGVTDARSNANTKLQKQFVSHTFFRNALESVVRGIVAQALADNLTAPADIRVQELATIKAPKRPAPEEEKVDSDSSKKSRRATPDNSDRESTPGGTKPRRHNKEK
jgi:hypothetical protein